MSPTRRSSRASPKQAPMTHRPLRRARPTSCAACRCSRASRRSSSRRSRRSRAASRSPAASGCSARAMTRTACTCVRLGHLQVLQQEIPINTITRGAVLGELALLNDSARSASVRAMRDSELLRIDRDSFEALLRSEPELALGLTRVLSAQLQASRAIPPARRARPVTIALRSLSPGVPLLELADDLSRALCARGRVAVLYPEDATAAAAATRPERRRAERELRAGGGALRGRPRSGADGVRRGRGRACLERVLHRARRPGAERGGRQDPGAVPAWRGRRRGARADRGRGADRVGCEARLGRARRVGRAGAAGGRCTRSARTRAGATSRARRAGSARGRWAWC